MTRQVVDLRALALAPTVAHGGVGAIGVHRVFAGAELASACNFVDYAEIPPGASIGRHRHGQNEELYLILEGTGTMHLDGAEHRVAAGTVILNRPGGVHGLVNDGPGVLRIFVVEVAMAPPGTVDDHGPV